MDIIYIHILNVGYVEELKMIRALILYLLNIKPSHGYNIQRFIEVNGIDKWSRIQSGSIYYALDKLEKEGYIYTLKEERNGARIRKIYDITDEGKEELRNALKKELEKPIAGAESDKFMIYSMINKLTKEEITASVEKHLKVLREKKVWWEKGKKIKITEKSLKLEVLNFDMVISNLDYQIKWHEALLEQLDQVIESDNAQEQLISNVDFSTLNDVNYNDIDCEKYAKIEKFKAKIMQNPTDNLEQKLNEFIKLLTQK